MHHYLVCDELRPPVFQRSLSPEAGCNAPFHNPVARSGRFNAHPASGPGAMILHIDRCKLPPEVSTLTQPGGWVQWCILVASDVIVFVSTLTQPEGRVQ